MKGRAALTEIQLRSLAPEYNEDHHKTYVSRLNAAVTDPRNKNIALTGRYGAGKSSILDQFIKDQEKPAKQPASKWRKIRRSNDDATKILRISINTLGPDEGEDLTNRIQKELVKQLVYRARPGEVRTSKFARAPELKLWRAGIDALVVAMVVVSLFWLFGLRPVKDSLGADGFLWPMVAFLVLAFVALWILRWYIGSRVVAQVSAGGALIALEQKSDSFFDRYLDELVAFFEATEPDIVVFEDLDRFDDPRIFDSLRELNNLVNTSAHWKDRPDKPLRFVYAIKDSLFEKLGDEQQDKDAAGILEADGGNDSSPAKPAPATADTSARVAAPGAKRQKHIAAEAVERANRTKFFEIVIPVVPFLSHSNARDLYLKELKKLGLPEEEKIAYGLIDVVARHTTDMRLMINIGNEFIVYAERLLWVDESRQAPGITPDRLFALVVYKNFHLADFEALPHRGSALDTLEKARRDLVDTSIEGLQKERADLAGGATRQQKQRELAVQLGRRLSVLLESASMALRTAKIGNKTLDVDSTSEPGFWQPIGLSGSVEMRFQDHYGQDNLVLFGKAKLDALFPEASQSESWRGSAPSDKSRQTAIDEEITALRGADFQSLVDDDRYNHNGITFGAMVEKTLPSQLARDLVKKGYIDRFYAEYASVFYGEFLGVDVANFFRNSVWPNEMDMQFAFTTDGAVRNVLDQAPADFLSTRSAFNVEIVDHLMDLDADSSHDLLDSLARPNNMDGQHFLRTYFNTPRSRSAELVSRLAARPWSELVSFLAAEGSVDTDETNVSLLNAALLGAREFEDLRLDDAARALITRLHAEIPAFRDAQPDASPKTLFAFLMDSLPTIPRLHVLSPELQGLAVGANRYELTADNLRTAASLGDEEPISADNLIAKDAVWTYCAENVDDYLKLIGSDEHTTSSCASSEVFSEVINTKHEDWLSEQIEAFVAASAESAALPDITVVAQATWQPMVAAFRMLPNVSNLVAYASINKVDEALGLLLADAAGGVVEITGLENATEEQLVALIPQLLNADEALTPSQRVLLTAQLLDAPERPVLDLTEIEASPDDLLAELLRAGLVDDSEETFAHFSRAGWSSIGSALQVSKNAETFVTPALVRGHATEVVREEGIPNATRRAVLGRVTEFAPTEDSVFLISAASAARALRVLLPAEALTVLAPAVCNQEDIVWQLHEQSGSFDAAAIMHILGRMSGDFAGFAGSSGHKFEVATTPSLKAVLDLLKVAGRIKLQPGGQPRGRWKLRIA
jgi:hypothetical protein